MVELGFDRAYLQPGYFYRTDAEYWRLTESATRVNSHLYLPYVEFNSQAHKSNANWGYRLENTIEVFDLSGFWDTHQIGYYQGFNTWYSLFSSNDSEDRDLYNKLAEIIVRRQKQK